MEKFKQLEKIKEVYAKGGNLIKYLKSVGKNKKNTIEDILISYDFQSGSYVKGLAKNLEYKKNYCKALSDVISNLESIDSIIEVGVGEATTLGVLLNYLVKKPKHVFGFDISWSRIKFARAFLKDIRINNASLFTANLFEIPLLDNAIDLVYTSHSIEPNGGKETEALKELYRITNKYLVLLEPAFELASEEAKQRMIEHGYVTNLYETAKSLNYKIVDYRLFEYSSNPLNPTGLLIIEKEQSQDAVSKDFVCPLTHSKLVQHGETLLFSNETFLSYPVVDDIPCLLKENSILTTHLKTDFEKFKIEHNIDYKI